MLNGACQLSNWRPLARTLKMLRQRGLDAALRDELRSQDLAYSAFVDMDGTVWLHNRAYEPILQRSTDGAWKAANRGQWVKRIVYEPSVFYFDDDPPRTKLRRALRAMLWLGAVGKVDYEAIMAATPLELRDTDEVGHVFLNEAGRGFRFQSGHRSCLKPAIPIGAPSGQSG